MRKLCVMVIRLHSQPFLVRKTKPNGLENFASLSFIITCAETQPCFTTECCQDKLFECWLIFYVYCAHYFIHYGQSYWSNFANSFKHLASWWDSNSSQHYYAWTTGPRKYKPQGLQLLDTYQNQTQTTLFWTIRRQPTFIL